MSKWSKKKEKKYENTPKRDDAGSKLNRVKKKKDFKKMGKVKKVFKRKVCFFVGLINISSQVKTLTCGNLPEGSKIIFEKHFGTRSRITLSMRAYIHIRAADYCVGKLSVITFDPPGRIPSERKYFFSLLFSSLSVTYATDTNLTAETPLHYSSPSSTVIKTILN